MLCRALLATIAISYLICVLFLSGIQKEDLDMSLLKKLQHHNIDFNDPTLREQCENKTIRRSDLRLQEYLREGAIATLNVTAKEKLANSEDAREKYSDEFNITGLDLDNMLKHLENSTYSKSEETTIQQSTSSSVDQLITTGKVNKKDDNSKTISDTKISVDKNETLQNPQTKPKLLENSQLKLESLQNIIMFWEEYNKKMKTSATPMSTTKMTIKTQTEIPLITASSVTEKQRQNNGKTTYLDEVERISKLVADMLSKNATEHKKTISTTLAPVESTLINPREIEEKFALSLTAINKLNENIANLQKNLQSSVANKSNENEYTTSKVGEGVMLFSRDSAMEIAKNLDEEKHSNQDRQTIINSLQNKDYSKTNIYNDEAFKRDPDHDCTPLNKHLLHASKPLSVQVEHRNQNNPKNYKQTSQNLNTVETMQVELYQNPNKNSLNLGSLLYIKPEENKVSMVKHNSHNQLFQKSVTNMANYAYSNANAVNTYDIPKTNFNSGESSSNVDYSIDKAKINKLESESTISNHKGLQNRPSQYIPKMQNFVDYEKRNSNLEPNGIYNLETIENGSPQASPLKVLEYPYTKIFLNNQTPINENEYTNYKTNQQHLSDDTSQYLKNFREKATNYARDIEQQIVDNFKNKEHNQRDYNFKTLINNSSPQVPPVEVLQYRYENTLPNTQTYVDLNNNFKTNQQYSYNDNSDRNLKYSGEQTTNFSRAEEQQIAIDTFKNDNGQLYQPQYRYITDNVYVGAMQNLSKDRIALEQNLLNYKKEKNQEKVNLPADVINQIADSVKKIILKDLSNAITTSLNLSSSPSTRYSPKYQTITKPVSLATISFDTITSATLTTTTPSPFKAISLNDTKPVENKPFANSTISIIVSTPRSTNLTDPLMEQKIDRVQQATQAIEKFLDLFNKYSTTAQEKTDSLNNKNKHPKTLAKSVAIVPQSAPLAMFPPPLPAINPYGMRLQQKPVVIHHYNAPQIPTPPASINLNPGMPVTKPLQLTQNAYPRQYPQPIMIQTNLNEIQPIRVPITNFHPMNIVVPTPSPFKNQEERNRWNFMLKYGRNPDKKIEIENTKQSLDDYSHVKSIQYSPPNYMNFYNENPDNKKSEHLVVNKTNIIDNGRLDPYVKYILSKYKNENEKNEYQPPELLQSNVESINEKSPDTNSDTQYPLSNINSTYYKNMAAQFDALNTGVAVMNLNPSYINMMKDFGLNQNMKPEEFDPNHSIYNEKPENVMLEENVEPQTNKRIENYINNYKDPRFYNNNRYNIFGQPKVERNYDEDGNVHVSISRLKDSNQDYSGQYNEKHLGNNLQVHNTIPTKKVLNKQQFPDNHIKKLNILPKNVAQNKNAWNSVSFNNINKLKNPYEPELKYNRNPLDIIYSKKHVTNKNRNLDRISESPLNGRLILTSSPSFNDLLLLKRIDHQTGKHNHPEERKKHSVNKNGQSLISRGPFDASLGLNNHHTRFENKNEKWQQHKARTSAVLGRNRYINQHSNEGNYYDNDGGYREYRMQAESSGEKPRHKQTYYDTSDSDKRYNNMEILGFHDKLEGKDDWKSIHGNIFSRQQLPLAGRPKSDDVHFKNFLKTQQKVNEMLEKILASKSEGLKSVEAI